MSTQSEKADAFRKLHEHGSCFVVPNPWDFGSARLLEHLGFKALASSSAGFAFSIAKSDLGISKSSLMTHLSGMCQATSLPVSADLQNGFGNDPEDAAVTILQAAKTGIVGALAVSYAAKRLFWRTTSGEPFMLEMPGYKLPQLRSLAIGVWARALAFLKRAGTTILSMMILIWVLASFPGAPEGANEPAIAYSLAAMIGHAIEPITAPLGFNWQINVALIPGMAAREVAVGALGTIYAIDGGEGAAAKIGQVLAGHWSLATALALLAWYVFAPQCASTLAVIRRETGGWQWMAVTFAYMLGLAYVAALATYQIARAFGAG